jgi:hypothetical protein
MLVRSRWEVSVAIKPYLMYMLLDGKWVFITQTRWRTPSEYKKAFPWARKDVIAIRKKDFE